MQHTRENPSAGPKFLATLKRLTQRESTSVFRTERWLAQNLSLSLSTVEIQTPFLLKEFSAYL